MLPTPPAAPVTSTSPPSGRNPCASSAISSRIAGPPGAPRRLREAAPSCASTTSALNDVSMKLSFRPHVARVRPRGTRSQSNVIPCNPTGDEALAQAARLVRRYSGARRGGKGRRPRTAAVRAEPRRLERSAYDGAGSGGHAPVGTVPRAHAHQHDDALHGVALRPQAAPLRHLRRALAVVGGRPGRILGVRLGLFRRRCEPDRRSSPYEPRYAEGAWVRRRGAQLRGPGVRTVPRHGASAAVPVRAGAAC